MRANSACKRFEAGTSNHARLMLEKIEEISSSAIKSFKLALEKKLINNNNNNESCAFLISKLVT
ncbi:hypothetical protein PUN28_009541 [Cardiocondyla obscurior]|uniref:Uncharacterized protein n=1 Tax=Cardiocondyla obscurior TaxID=286306 RepID=A0AAW2FW68_9HYME